MLLIYHRASICDLFEKYSRKTPRPFSSLLKSKVPKRTSSGGSERIFPHVVELSVTLPFYRGTPLFELQQKEGRGDKLPHSFLRNPTEVKNNSADGISLSVSRAFALILLRQEKTRRTGRGTYFKTCRGACDDHTLEHPLRYRAISPSWMSFRQ